MDEAKPNIFAEMAGELFKLVGEMITGFFSILPK